MIGIERRGAYLYSYHFIFAFRTAAGVYEYIGYLKAAGRNLCVHRLTKGKDHKEQDGM
jgi:hypothetical protein